MSAVISDAIQQELVNWSRWCWRGPLPHPLPPTHCGSLESGYRSPPEWNDEDQDEAPPPPKLAPNERHAKIIQAAYDAMPLPMRQVLKAEYPARWESGRTRSLAEAAYNLSMPQWLYQSLLNQAIRKLEAAFAVRA